jgi:hypothetical protein
MACFCVEPLAEVSLLQEMAQREAFPLGNCEASGLGLAGSTSRRTSTECSWLCGERGQLGVSYCFDRVALLKPGDKPAFPSKRYPLGLYEGGDCDNDE